MLFFFAAQAQRLLSDGCSSHERSEGTLFLSTHVVEIYHDAIERPGSARITLTAELTDPARETLMTDAAFNRNGGFLRCGRCSTGIQ